MTAGQFWAEFGGHLAMLGGLLAASAFFSGTETACFNLTRSQLQKLKQSRSRLGKQVCDMMLRPRRLLNTLLLCNMLVNTAYAGISGAMVVTLSRQGVPAWVPVAATVAPLLALILVGEVTPKTLAFLLGERWALTAAPLMSVIGRLLSPLILTMQAVLINPLTRLLSPSPSQSDITSDELAALLDLSAKRGLIGHDANELLQQIVELAHIRVGDVMVPRVDMVTCDVNEPAQGLIDLFARTGLHRIPVYDGDVDHILGVVTARRLLLNPEKPLRELVTPVFYVPEAASAERVLLQLRVKRQQLAIVVDEYGGTAGLVSVEDIVEEIVGDISDLRDGPTESAVTRIGETEYLIDGDLAIHEWGDAFHMDISGRRVSTIGGFVVSLLGRIPRVGDTARYRNLHFTVEAVRRGRIGRLRLSLHKKEEP